LEEELDLYEIWQIVVKRWRLILAIPLIATVLSTAVSLFILTPQYQASTTLVVVKPTETAQILFHDIQVSRQLVDTYREIAYSATVLNGTLTGLRLPYSLAELREQVAVTAVRNTEIINISATNPDPETARDIANEVAQVFTREVLAIYKVENVSVIDRAVIPEAPVSPRVPLNMAVAFVIGLFSAVSFAFLQTYLDKTIKTPQDVQRHLQLHVLGIILCIED